MVDNLIGSSIYSELKKAAEDRGIWHTLRRDCREPAESTDHSEKEEYFYENWCKVKGCVSVCMLVILGLRLHASSVPGVC